MDAATINYFLELNKVANRYTTHGRYELTLLNEETIDVAYVGASRGFYAELTLAARGMLAFYDLYFTKFKNFNLNINCSAAWPDHTPPGTKDLYPILYKRNLNIEFKKCANFQHTLEDIKASNRIYKNIDFSQLNNLYQHHYAMSDLQEKYYAELLNKYNINYDNLVGVWYRGTDKATEATLAPPTQYAELAEKIISKDSKLKVLIQSDQTQVVDLFKNTFKDRCLVFEEMPTTSGDKGYHKIIKNQEKVQFYKTLDICTRILSKCRYFINHTGNGGFVAQVHRNSPQNMWQFDITGELINP
jgi:hypothetical protein